jgi:hypothetical protein
MRITTSRRSARLVLATIAGITFALFGAGTAHADDQTPPTSGQTQPVATPSPTEHADNFPWG